MKLKFSINGLIAAFVMAAIIGGLAASEFGNTVGLVSFALAFGVPLLGKPVLAVLVSLVPSLGQGMTNTNGLALMAIQAEVWQNHIENNMYKDNEFLLASTDAGQYVMQGKVVHIPQSGNDPDIEKNRSVVPATASERTDIEVSYLLDAYSTDPILIRNAETFELSYNKRESVIGSAESKLRQRIADEILIKWAPTASGNIVYTSGASVASHVTGTTGNRLALVTSDLRMAQLAMNKQNVSKYERYALISSDMYNQLLESLSDTQNRDFSAAMNAQTGVVPMLYGFKIMQRTDVVIYNAAVDAVNAFGAVVAVDDNDAVLCWQKDAVERAMGSITFFERANDPLFYGDVYSFEVRMGGRKRRNDQKGIIAIVQKAV